MHSRLYACLLILLIALQSVMTMAELYPCDQAERVQGNPDCQGDSFNEADMPLKEDKPLIKNPFFTASDCLDCTDCYCCFYLSLPTAHFYSPSIDPGQLIDNNVLSIPETPRFLLLRPPKA